MRIHSRPRTSSRLVLFALAFLICGLLAARLRPPARAAGVTQPYVDPAQFTSVPFGDHSHWAQPWRAYLETVPAKTFVNGLGINFNTQRQDPDLVARMLAAHGIRHARIEVGWGDVNYDDESRLNSEKALRARLLACKHYGIRPLILLNANQGLPTPSKISQHTVTADAHKGDTTLQIDDAGGLRANYSGVSNLTKGWAAEDLATSVSGNTLTLSKPLPKDLPAGTKIPVATMKYRPFSAPGTADYQETIAGWQKYVGTVAAFATSVLGTDAHGEHGFDMEIWNELTFGTDFLSINRYYSGKVVDVDQKKVYSGIVGATADYVNAHADEFSGVRFDDGFGNTSPFTASSLEPARINALGKHPYEGRKVFPHDDGPGTNLNALYQKDPYVPAYTEFFPEYYGSFIQTESMVRDMGPIPNTIYRIAHGRDARTPPCEVWITEVNVEPGADDKSITRERALAVKAKALARYACFFLNKGVTQLDFFAAMGGDLRLGVVQDNFLDLAKTPGASYPSDDSSYTSPALTVLGRISRQLKEGMDSEMTDTHPVNLLSVADTHDHVQFTGDGTAAHPNLYDRDVFAFLPFQVNAHRFVIPYYVMTRDFMKDLAPEDFTLRVTGLSPSTKLSAYDPTTDSSVPVTVRRDGNALSVHVSATDSPRLLIAQE